jgi:hypothetical protein
MMNKFKLYIIDILQIIKLLTISIPIAIIIYTLFLIIIFIKDLFKTIKNINHEYRFKSFWKRR